MDTYSTEMLKLSLSADLCIGVPIVGHFCSELDYEITLGQTKAWPKGI